MTIHTDPKSIDPKSVSAGENAAAVRVLSVEGLTKTYGELSAVADANLAVGEGEFIAIVGRSGSGKSTLMGMIGGLMRPTAGKVVIGGEDISALPEGRLAELRRAEIGFVFQFPSLLPNLSALDNVALPGLLGSSSDPAEAYGKARDLLARVGLGRRLDAFPHELSGGEQRRVVIARALVNSPRLLLADEPTGDLDEDTEREIIDVIESLRRTNRFAFVLVTHNVDLTAHADRAFVMDRGHLKPFSAPAAPAARPAPQARRFEPVLPPEEQEAPPPDIVSDRRLGRALTRQLGWLAATAAVILAIVLGVNYGVEQYQAYQIAQKRERLAALEQLATSTLRGDIDSVTPLGGNKFRVGIYLENSNPDGQPIYIMSPDMHAFIQTGMEWRELPLEPVGESTASVLKVTGRQIYSYVIDANVAKYTELLPYYMHIRFTNAMLVSPESNPKDEIFNRTDNYYIYLKPDGVDDAMIAKKVKFPGPPPLWIWMPPH